MHLLTINCGSSSVRLAAFRVDGARLEPVLERHLDGPGADADLEAFLREAALAIDAVAHRVVHGGAFDATVRIDAAVEAEIKRLVALAPLHNAPALDWIRRARAALGARVPQLAVFDTAFFAGLPEAARTYALPQALMQRLGVRRYGFHGLAHRAMWRRWIAHRPEMAQRGRAITFQLGSGCSAAAIAGGRALDTSMGFTPLAGLVMATRAGDLDPGLVAWLLRESGLAPEAFERLLARESGLRGLAGEGDMRRLMARDDAQARLALEVYCHRARHYLGAYLTVLGGTDAVLFGGGVGENQSAIRARILRDMGWAGIGLGPANDGDATERRIGAAGASVDVWVIRVDEARILAEEALAALQCTATEESRP